jgi:energy-coupling factor transport system substrate-specific component
MSWELASFLILGAVLLAGFVWYERSRPPSQTVALVAALAALAVAGRVAFAAFPNVKPTTDLVIFAGYALGGAPGFAVGALTALVSNFWFGQGPWTPWQMAGWGMCGILGAALALGGRNVGRLGLAAFCGFAGIAYGALLNFSLMATYGGDLSLRHFGVLEARAVPFDAAHAAGNVAFALIAGPAMLRMLTRFRQRFEWRIRPALGGGVAATIVALVLLAGLAPARAQATTPANAADWLESVQNADGGYGASPGDASGAEMTCWAMLGLEAAGRNPFDVASGGHTPVDFLRNHLGELSSPGDLARTILALQGAGADPREFGGENLVSQLLGRRRANGSYEGWPNSTAYAAIALRAAGISGGIEGTLSWLRSVQNDDGGWGDTPGSPSNADGTGAVLQALSGGSKASDRGLSYLRDAQHKGGGFALGGNGAVNTQSTAWAVQGILAAGGDPGSFRRGGASAPEYLANNQEGDGSYRYAKPGPEVPDEVAHQTPVWVTGEVLIAASGDHLPISPPPRKPAPTPSQTGSSNFGLTPGTALPPETAPETEPGGLPGSGGGGIESLRERFAPSGNGASGAPGDTPPPVAPVPPAGEAPEAGASQSTAPGTEAASTDSPSSSGTAGSILVGLLAGCLLFGAAWAGRRGWMRWRYGL